MKAANTEGNDPPQTCDGKSFQSWFDCVLIAGTVLHGFWSMTLPMAISRLDPLPDRTVIFIPSLTREAALWVAGIVLLTASWIRRRRRNPHDPSSRWGKVCRRMSLLVVVVLGCRLLLWHFPSMSANILYFGVPAVMAWALTGTLPETRICRRFGRRERVEWLLILTGVSLLYCCLGVHFTNAVGEHSGDEGHYLIQASSLFHDRDLDIANNFENPEAVSRAAVHISDFSRDGKWYSWHSRGLAMLLAPTVPGGLAARHLVLGLISGFGIAGVYLLCIQVGVSRSSVLSILLMLGGSVFWGIYSCRALPEVLGATLATYAMVAIFAQEKHPWISAVVAALTISCLPWAHTRFIPLALAGGGCYGLRALLNGETWAAKVRHLTVFAILCVLGLGGYQAFQFSLFEGGTAYPIGKLLFSFPLGLWHTLASARGILSSFPVFACALLACVYLLIKGPHRSYALCAFLFFLSVFLTSSSTPWFAGGACLQGRFLLVVVPVLMVCLGRVLPNTSAGFRWLSWYLGLLSMWAFAMELTVLQDLHKAFADPLAVDWVHPLFEGLARVLYDPRRTTHVLPGILLYGSLAVLLFLPNPGRGLQNTILASLAALACILARKPSSDRLVRYPPHKVARTLEYGDVHRAGLFVVGDARMARDLRSFSNRFAARDLRPAISVTTEDLGAPSAEGRVSLPNVPANDWEGRGYRWATLVPPFRTGRGKRLLVLDAELSDTVSAEFTIREGNRNVVGKHYNAGSDIHDAFTFSAEDAGDIYVLVRLEGHQGEFTCHRMAYTAVSDALLRKANLALQGADGVNRIGN